MRFSYNATVENLCFWSNFLKDWLFYRRTDEGTAKIFQFAVIVGVHLKLIN